MLLPAAPRAHRPGRASFASPLGGAINKHAHWAVARLPKPCETNFAGSFQRQKIDDTTRQARSLPRPSHGHIRSEKRDRRFRGTSKFGWVQALAEFPKDVALGPRGWRNAGAGPSRNHDVRRGASGYRARAFEMTARLSNVRPAQSQKSTFLMSTFFSFNRGEEDHGHPWGR